MFTPWPLHNTIFKTEPDLSIVVDCKALARVLNGQESLVNKDMVPLCTRVTDRLIDLQKFWNQLYVVRHG